jgi:hypothetical protein
VLLQWIIGIFVLTPIVIICTAIGFVLSIPLYVRMLPWDYVAFRPHRFILSGLMLFGKIVREWIMSRAFGGMIFAKSVSCDTHPRSWQLPYGIRVRFRILWILQRYFGMDKFLGMEKKVYADALAYCKKNPPTKEQIHLEIPRVNPDEITPEEFYEKYVKSPHPVILTGMNKNSDCVKKWGNLDYFYKFKDAVAPVTETGESPDVERLKFGDYIDWVKANRNTELEDRKDHKYLANFANLFNWHPELVDELDVKKMSKWLGPTNNALLGCHFFLGLKDTATPFHCANTMNWFVQVVGQKRWTFVHPEHTMFLYPIYSHDVFYTGSMLEYPEPEKEIMDMDFPLWQYCPRYEAILNPGDVLLNPSWYWHRINNDNMTIGCATRWSILPPMDTNVFNDLLLSFCARFWSNALILLSRKQGCEPKLTDETTLTIDQRLSRFHQGKTLALLKRPSVITGKYTKHPWCTLRVPKEFADYEAKMAGTNTNKKSM